MALIFYHPKVAYRDCEHCQKYLYNEDSGTVDMNTRFDPPRPRERTDVIPPPCRIKSIGCPKGTPEENRGLSAKNRQAYEHYLQCKAVGKFPEDAIVYRNAGIIRRIEDSFGRFETRELRDWIKALMQVKLS